VEIDFAPGRLRNVVRWRLRRTPLLRLGATRQKKRCGKPSCIEATSHAMRMVPQSRSEAHIIFDAAEACGQGP